MSPGLRKARLPSGRARHRSHRDDAGMSTAEYAVGTVAAACIGCILVQLAQGDGSFLWDFLTAILSKTSSLVPFLDGFPGPNRPWLM